MKPYRILTLLAFYLVLINISFAQTVNLTLVKTIESPRKFIPGVEDKAGYWKDYGTTEAFDFYPATNSFVALIKETNGPARLYFYNIVTGTALHTVIITNNINTHFKAMKFSPDGKLIAIPMGKEKEITLWDGSDGALIGRKKTDDEATNVDWSPDGKTLAVVAGKWIEIWGVDTFERKKTIKASRAATEWPSVANWSPDGAYLAIGTNNPALYIGKNGTQSSGLQPNTKGSIYVAEWNAGGNMLATVGFGSNSNIAIWKDPKNAVDFPSEKKYELIRTIESTPNTSWNKLIWDPSGRLIICGDNKKNLFIWNAASGQVVKTFQPTNSNTSEVKWKGRFLVTVGTYPDKFFKIWRAEIN